MLDFKKEIKSAFAENKLAIGVSAAILFISLILGYFLEPYLHSILGPVLDSFSKQVKSGAIKLTFQSIFSNNIRIVFLMFIFGLLFCFCGLILGFNGFFVGYFTATTDNLFNTVLLLIPHGIFEFSSCILACSSGFVLFRFAYNLLRTWFGEADKSFYDSYVENFDKLKQAILLLMVSTILMAIAGFVEVYLTISIADFISSIFT